MASGAAAGTMADPGLAGALEAPLAGSRAVLAALRSLQEKIRRLEAERNSHLGNYESLRTKFEVQRAQAEAALQQELTAHEHAEQRHRAALAQLEEQLRRLGDERDAAVAAHQSVLQRTAEQQLQTDRLLGTVREEQQQRERLLQQQLERTTAEVVQLKDTLAQAEQREKELLVSLESQESAQQRGWQQQLASERRMLEACQQQKQQLQATVADLLKLNNALLARVREPEQPAPSKKAHKKASRPGPSQHHRTQTLDCSGHPYDTPLTGTTLGAVGALARPAAAAAAAAGPAAPPCCAARPARAATPCRSRSPTLSSLAKAVSHPAASRCADSPEDGPVSPGLPRGGTAHDHLHRANLGPVPFLLGTSTTSYSAVAAAQMGLEVGRDAALPTADTIELLPSRPPCVEEESGDTDLAAGLQELTTQLEAEYTALNQQYLHVLRQVQATSGINTTADLTALLNRLLEDMDAKGHQIRKLRRIELASHLSAAGRPAPGLVAGLERRARTLRLFSTLKQQTHCRPMAP